MWVTCLVDCNRLKLVFTCDKSYVIKIIGTHAWRKKIFCIALNVSDWLSNYSTEVINLPIWMSIGLWLQFYEFTCVFTFHMYQIFVKFLVKTSKNDRIAKSQIFANTIKNLWIKACKLFIRLGPELCEVRLVVFSIYF